MEFRTLMKAYGIRFDVMVNGKVCAVYRVLRLGSAGGGMLRPWEADWPPAHVHLLCLHYRQGSSASSPRSSTSAPGWRSWVL